MRRPCPEKEAFWRFVLSEQAGSGLSISEFCRREDISQASFYQWRKRLTDSPRAAEQRPAGTSAGVSFIPVEVVPNNDSRSLSEPSPACPGSPSSTSARLTIRTPQGYAIDVTSSTSVDVLQRSLRALQHLAGEPKS